MRAGQLDRLPVESVGGRAVAEQSPDVSLDASTHSVAATSGSCVRMTPLLASLISR